MQNGSVLSKPKMMTDNRRLPMILLGNRKENYLGQLTGRDTNPIPKLLSFIFLSVHPLLGGFEVASQTRGGLYYLDPGVRMENGICFIFSYLSRARK